MPSPQQIIYDIEGALETAIKSVFTAAEVNAFTSQDTPEFQRDIPRVELRANLGAGRGQWFKVSGVFRETSWQCALALRLFTAANMVLHTQYRAQIRALMHGIGNSINSDPLIHHKIQPFWMDAGTSPTLKPEDGTYETEMNFNVEISIQNDAWALLTT